MRALAWIACLCALSAPGCKRDADAPLPQSELFPPLQPQTLPQTAVEPLARLGEANAREPDDDPSHALRVAPGTVVIGAFGDQASLGKGGESDWLRVEPLPPAGEMLHIDVREGPECLRLELYDRAEGTPIRTAAPWHGQLPTLPALQLTGTGVWLRLHCVGKQLPGPWRVALTARPAALDDEREPNDTPSADTRLLGLGQTVQGLLAPVGDVDVLRLELGNALPGDALLVSVTGVPELALELTLQAEPGAEPLLRRRGAVGEPILVPNLDVRRVGERPWLVLRALKGQRTDSAYALTVRPLLPAGCRAQGSCPERIPVEREPNETQATAMGIRADSLITGLLDNPDDVDVYAVDAEPGDVIDVEVDPPEGVRVRMGVAEGSDAWATLIGEEAGAPVVFAGRRVRGRRVHITVAAESGASRTSPYMLRVRARPSLDFEHEGEAHELLGRVDAADFLGWRGQGALLPSGDIDEFAIDVGAPAGQGRTVQLGCQGDGGPGLRCRLRGGDGRWLAEVQSDSAAEGAAAVLATPVLVGTGPLQVVVDRAGPAVSLRPYRVTLVDQGLVALPGESTPVGVESPGAAPAAATPPASPAPAPAPVPAPALPPSLPPGAARPISPPEAPTPR